MDYKLSKEQLGQIEEMNEIWLKDYKKLNPNDMITTGYAIATKINEYWYVIKDNITEKYIKNYIEITERDETIETEANNEII
jgi:uncharacterized Fe-S radical SAM superfamily protein PflX